MHNLFTPFVRPFVRSFVCSFGYCIGLGTHKTHNFYKSPKASILSWNSFDDKNTKIANEVPIKKWNRISLLFNGKIHIVIQYSWCCQQGGAVLCCCCNFNESPNGQIELTLFSTYFKQKLAKNAYVLHFSPIF